MSSSFIFINKGRAIKNNENQKILRDLYMKIEDNSKLTNMEYLKSCLFVINMFDKLSENEMNIDGILEDISTILFGNNKLTQNINASIFNAKSYSEYIKESNYLSNIDDLFESLRKEYLSQFHYTSFLKESNYPKFCLTKIKNKLKNIGIQIDNTVKCDNEFNQLIHWNIENIISLLQIQLKKSDEKNINETGNILQQIQLNLKSMKFYKDSFCQGFFNNLCNQILRSEQYKGKDYIIRLKNSFKCFDSF